MAKLIWNPPIVHDINCTYEWPVDYAADVHEGQMRQDGTMMPARRWTDAAIQNINLGDLYARNFKSVPNIETAFRDTAIDLGAEFIHEIESPIWDWDRATRRSDGSIATTPRDIVDTGALRDSMTVTFS